MNHLSSYARNGPGVNKNLLLKNLLLNKDISYYKGLASSKYFIETTDLLFLSFS